MTAVLFFLTAHAAEPVAPPAFMEAAEVAKHEKLIGRLENYLSGLSTIVSDFTQIAPDGSLTSGKFFLKRPGKMRWQYNPPTPILMVANSSEMVFYDYELEQESHIPLDDTMIGFLAQEKVRFDGMVGIQEIEQAAGVIRIALAQREKPSEGQLMLEFTDRPLSIRNMVITDATGQRTSVALNNARYGLDLKNELFLLKAPYEKGHRKR